MNEYLGLAELRRYREHATGQTKDDDLLRLFTGQASRWFEQMCHGRLFFPKVETRTFDFTNTLLLRLDNDLLELSEVAIDGEVQVLADFFVYPLNVFPKSRIEVDVSSASSFTFSNTPQKAITITGIWGYHEAWNDAWIDTLDSSQQNMLAGDTTLEFADIDGLDENGELRVTEQSTIRLENEYMYISAVDTGTNIATVVRGINGTTAATHAQFTQIDRFQPMAVVIDAVRHRANWMYLKRDTPEDGSSTVIIPGTGAILPEIPQNIRMAIRTLRDKRL